MNDKQIIIQAKLSSNDIFVFQVSYAIRQWYVWLFSYLSIVSIGIILYRLSVGELSEVPSQAWFFSLIIIFLIWSLFINSKKNSKNKLLNEEKTFKITKEHFIMESESTTQQIRWQEFNKFIITKRFIYLFIANNSAHIVPISTLSNDEKLFVVQHIKSKVKKHKMGCLFVVVIGMIIFLVTVGILQFFISK